MSIEFSIPVTNVKFHIDDVEGELSLYPDNIYEVKKDNKLIQHGKYELVQESGNNFIEFDPVVIKKRYRINLSLT